MAEASTEEEWERRKDRSSKRKVRPRYRHVRRGPHGAIRKGPPSKPKPRA